MTLFSELKKVKRIIFLLCIIVFWLTACTSREICEPNGEVYQFVLQNHEEYIDYFRENTNSSHGLTISVKDYLYVVWSNGRGGFYVATRNGLGAAKTRFGYAGYYYVASGQTPPSSEFFTYSYLGNNIYCYKKNDMIFW